MRNPFKRRDLLPTNVANIIDEGISETWGTVQNEPEPVQLPPPNPDRDVVIPDTNSPEYHLSIAAQLHGQLMDRKHKLEQEVHELAIAYEADRQDRERDYKARRVALEADIANASKSAEFYALAPSVLKTPDKVDPARMDAVGKRIAETKRKAKAVEYKPRTAPVEVLSDGKPMTREEVANIPWSTNEQREAALAEYDLEHSVSRSK